MAPLSIAESLDRLRELAAPPAALPAKPELSVVVPLFNEEQNVAFLLDRLTRVCDGLAIEYEIILVDDGSRDGTWAEIKAGAERTPRLHGVRLSRNFGHQHALLAGLGAASGRAVISMDGDLQHPPELIPELLANWRDGAQIVQTRRVYSRQTPAMKRLTSKYYYSFFTVLSGFPLEEGQSDFRLLDRTVLDQILSFGDSEMFLRGAVQWVGFGTRTITFTAADRRAGASSYGFARMLGFATSGVLGFSVKPLTLSIWLGFGVSALAFMELAYILYIYSQGATVQGWASTLGILSVLFGVLFFVIGIIGLYIGRIHQALLNRPRFIIQERLEPEHAVSGASDGV